MYMLEQERIGILNKGSFADESTGGDPFISFSVYGGGVRARVYVCVCVCVYVCVYVCMYVCLCVRVCVCV